MENQSISAIRAREILDSKGRPMVEVDVWTAGGVMGRGASPCGTSVGSHEAFVLRDGGKRFGGLGVQKAVRNVGEVLLPGLKGMNVLDQRAIDDRMVELDGSANKARLGANAIYSVSIAVARAAAQSMGVPLYCYLGEKNARRLPIPIFNLINGGVYPHGKIEIQEFILIPSRAPSFSEALRMGVEIFYEVGKTLKKRYGETSLCLGHSGGYAAPVNDPAGMVRILMEAAGTAGYAGMFRIGLDCAATHFFDKSQKDYHFVGKRATREQIIQFLEEMARSCSLYMVEDPLEEDDFDGFAEITRRLDLIISGDDLFVNNLNRLKRGISVGAANAMVLKPNMIGTLSEALDTADFARKHGYTIIASCRAGGSPDDPIPDVAVAVGAPLIKAGAPQTGERTSIQNRLLRIEEELGDDAVLCPIPKASRETLAP